MVCSIIQIICQPSSFYHIIRRSSAGGKGRMDHKIIEDRNLPHPVPEMSSVFGTPKSLSCQPCEILGNPRSGTLTPNCALLPSDELGILLSLFG